MTWSFLAFLDTNIPHMPRHLITFLLFRSYLRATLSKCGSWSGDITTASPFHLRLVILYSSLSTSLKRLYRNVSSCSDGGHLQYIKIAKNAPVLIYILLPLNLLLRSIFSWFTHRLDSTSTCSTLFGSPGRDDIVHSQQQSCGLNVSLTL